MSKVEVSKVATLTGHKDCVYTLEGTPSGNFFYSSGGDGLVVKWDLNNREHGELIAKTNQSVYALHLLPELNWLLVGENFEGIHAIDLKEKKEIKSTAITETSIFDIKSFKNIIIAATGDGSVVFLDKKDLSTIFKIKISSKSARCISVNYSAEEVAIGFSDNFIRIFDLNKLEVKKEILAHENSIFTLSYSPDEKYLLSGSRDAHLKVWNVNEDYQLHTSVVAHMFAINHITYSPDKKYFATCSLDKSLKVWDAETFRLLKVIDKARHAGHGTSVNKLWWSSYENLLVSGSDDRTISVWELNFN